MRSRRRGLPDVVSNNQAAYRLAKRLLGAEIATAKNAAWQQLIASIEGDSWGLPYRLVLNKLRGSTSSLLLTLEVPVLRQLVRKLFPAGDELPYINWEARWGWRWTEEWAVSVDEVRGVLEARNKRLISAPGPDVGLRLWRGVPPLLISYLAEHFSQCLKDGIFPDIWKVARLVLLLKSDTSVGQFPKARPICLLNEIGKIFERIIAMRMRNYMIIDPIVDIAPNQFGFRRGRSTSDALLVVKSVVRDAMSEGKVVLAISLDIASAFNSLLWRVIRRQVRWRKRFPIYLCRIIDGYLSNRWVEFAAGDGKLYRYRVRAGVPQGSVLLCGPLLWNVAFDDVARMGTFPGCSLVCYADDTLLLVVADRTADAIDLANRQVHVVVERIETLGLRVAHEKR